jgi:peptidyl-tRNA hydrolase
LPEGTADWADYVLAPFEPEQMEEVEALMPQMIEAVEKWIKS